MVSRQSGRRLRPGVEALDDRCLPSGFTPSRIAAAYGLGPIALTSPTGQTVAGDGSGQTIAVVVAFHNPNLSGDLKVFSDAFGLAEPQLQVVNLAGDATNAVWASESALDVQWAHALAPGASLLVVEAKSDTQSDLMDAVNVARNTPGVVAVSMSWGLPESPSQKTLDSIFTTPAGHTGITFVAASGDGGAAKGALYPASSPNVLGVGGTTLVADASGAYQSETIWAQSGSGISRYAAGPSYQRSLQNVSGKSVPDVSFLGDPDAGVQVYSTPPGSTTGAWQEVAGTSLGAPAWAAIVAIVAQGRALDGKPSLDGASQTLPLLYGLPRSSFNTIATGRIGTLAAGLGTPRGEAVIRGLVAIPSVSVDASSASSGASSSVSPLPRSQTVRDARHPRAARRVVTVRRQAAPTSRPLPAASRRGRIVVQATPQRGAVGRASGSRIALKLGGFGAARSVLATASGDG